ncbi:hypothetical protein [Sphingomonas montanisoli]|uniref:Uncharacterized protein n=1 Tax=Sphingomonas montanisoli TaxID=2606412 RepID=A0A5D9C7K5_9SPHN|nr:hypothetical protein [Sphingomonas montanisoli]TZG27237.1 hypothetical protein FYJ91_06335 [Sphingomonas montanisoli]
MSRSRKTSPYVGHTTAATDKPFKAQSSRRERRLVAARLGSTLDGDALPVKRWALTDPSESMKDGKQRIDDPDSRWLRK